MRESVTQHAEIKYLLRVRELHFCSTLKPVETSTAKYECCMVFLLLRPARQKVPPRGTLFKPVKLHLYLAEKTKVES